MLKKSGSSQMRQLINENIDRVKGDQTCSNEITTRAQ